MKKKKLLIALSIVACLSLLGVGIYYYVYEEAGDFIFQEMLESEFRQSIVEELGIDLSDPDRPLTAEELEKLAIASAYNDEDAKGSQQDKDTQTHTTNETTTVASSETAATHTDEQVAKDEGVATDTSQENLTTSTSEETEKTQTTKPSWLPDTLVTTGDILQRVEEQVEAIASVIPSEDKRAMTKLIVENLTTEDIHYLAVLVADGVSAQDLREAKRIAYSRFDDEQIEVVKMYYRRYKYLIP